MLTSDLALKLDSNYAPISKRFHEHPDQLADAFARAWFKADASRHGPARPISRPGGSGEELICRIPSRRR